MIFFPKHFHPVVPASKQKLMLEELIPITIDISKHSCGTESKSLYLKNDAFVDKGPRTYICFSFRASSFRIELYILDSFPFPFTHGVRSIHVSSKYSRSSLGHISIFRNHHQNIFVSKSSVFSNFSLVAELQSFLHRVSGRIGQCQHVPVHCDHFPQEQFNL